MQQNAEIAGELSAEELRSKLREWFEERGLLSDMRLQLRLKMIDALKDTPVGKVGPRKTVSPKQQAMNLLVAEFLHREGCFYSLSVFGTEMPLANILPAGVKDTDIDWKFGDTEVSDVLDTLGFSKNSAEHVEIRQIYSSSNESLLNCILRTICRSETVVNTDGATVAEVLKASNLPMLTVEWILSKITEEHAKEKEKYEKLSRELSKAETDQTLLRADYCEKIAELKKQKESWIKKSKMIEQHHAELLEKETQLQMRAAKIEKQDRTLNDLREDYQTKMENLKKESSCLNHKIEQLSEDNSRLRIANEDLRKNIGRLKSNARLLSGELNAMRRQRRAMSTSQPRTVSFSGEGEQRKSTKLRFSMKNLGF